MNRLRTVVIAFALSAAASISGAQGRIPAPEDVLGYRLGERYTSHEGISRYLAALAEAAPDRMKVVTYGSTYEGRALRLAVVSSPANLARLDEIRAQSRNLADPRVTTEREAASLARTMPAIAWLSYGVHGNEASGPEAALNVLHMLLSPAGPGTAGLLDSLVVVVDPLLNPDGHERYVNYEITRTGSAAREDPEAVEHNETWPSGRTNHYLFDLNRDWAWLTQTESRSRIAAYRGWMPQVHVDFHEMGYNSSYFFFPAFKPINKNFPPSTVEWGEIYGRGNAEAFDRKGWTYYSGESFDLFYPGYGDSWPSLHGAIGMTYEQAGQVGVKVKRRDEEILTLRDRLDHHSAASIATLRTTLVHREKRLRDFHRFFADAVAEGRNGPVRSFIIPPGRDPAAAARMVDLLIEQGVEVAQAGEEFESGDAQTYFPATRKPKSFPAGTFIIRLDQPEKRLVMALMEREPLVTDTSFYDISAWCLPIACGVEAWWSGAVPRVRAASIERAAVPEGSVSGEGKARYAYVFPWTSNNSVKALVRLLQAGYKAHTAMREFTLDGKRYDRGTIIVPVRPNPAGIDSAMRSLAAEFHLSIAAAGSGYTEGGMNLGSDRAVLLKRPKIAVLAGDPVSATAFGAIWSMFDQVYGIEFVPVDPWILPWIDLRKYTAIVFPDDGAGGGDYARVLDSNFVAKLKTWISSGGTYVGIAGGALFAAQDRAGISGTKIKSRKKKEEKGEEAKKKDDDAPDQDAEEELEKLMTVEEREKKRRREDVPGTIVRVKLDNSHPLGFGYDTTINVFRTTASAFELSASGYNVGVYTKSPRVSGHMSPENEKFMAGTPFLIHEQAGSGNIVLFGDDPNFRLFWDGLNRVFLNSVLVMPSIRWVGMAASEGHD